MHDLAWDDLRVLLSVRQAGSYARAASALRVDPATVGRRMRALRAALGAPLLEGPPRRLRLTAVGARAVEAARRMDEAAQALDRARVAAVSEVSGTLRLSVTDAIASRLVVPRLPGLLERFPALRVELVGGNEAVNLSRREADVALRLFRPEEPALTARRAGVLAFAPYVSAEYVRRRGLPTAADLGSHPCLGYDARLARGSPPLGWLEELGAPLRMRASSSVLLLAAVRSGLGVGVLPCFLGDADEALSRVAAPPRTRELWLVAHSDVRRSAPVRAGLEFLRAILAEAAPALRGERASQRP